MKLASLFFTVSGSFLGESQRYIKKELIKCLINSFRSPWGNRTPLARMKILSTNRYTNGPS